MMMAKVKVKVAAVVGVLAICAAVIAAEESTAAAAGAGPTTAATQQRIEGRLTDTQGQGLANVKMALTVHPMTMWSASLPGRSYVNGKEVPDDVWYCTTDTNGRFLFPGQNRAYLILAFTDEGYVLARSRRLAFPLTLMLTPWARLEGSVTLGGKSGPAEIGILATYEDDSADDLGPWPSFQSRTDAQGHFSLGRVLAGRYQVRRTGLTGAGGAAVTVQAAAGKVSEVAIPVVGNTIKGRLAVPKALEGLKWYDDRARLRRPAVLPTVTLPENILRMTAAERLAWYTKWEQSDEGLRHARILADLTSDRPPTAPLYEGSTFGFEDVPAGQYVIELQFYAAKDNHIDYDKQLGSAAYDLTVPDRAVDLVPADVGTLAPRAVEVTEAGQQAPDIVIPALEGPDHRLSEFRGKVVLLDFWGTWCGQCTYQLPELRAIHQAYGADPHFVMMSLSVDDERAQVERAVREHGLTWMHGVLGKKEDAWQTKLFMVTSYPSYWLIGPDGKVLAHGWQIAGIRPFVEKALREMK